MLKKEKEWYEQHGTPQEQQFVAKYGDRKVTSGSLFASVSMMVLLAGVVFSAIAAYLYISRVRFLQPVTGTWVGVMSPSENTKAQRAVYVHTSVSLTHWFSPSLAGTVRMCGKQGDMQFTLQQTRTVSADTLGVMLISADAQESGELFGVLRGEGLDSQYGGTNPGLEGQLRRGNVHDYEQACSGLRQ